MPKKFLSLGLATSIIVQVLALVAMVIALKNGETNDIRHFVVLFWICFVWMKIEQNSIKLDNIEAQLTIFDMDLIERRKLYTFDKYSDFVDGVFESMQFNEEDDVN